MTINAMRSYQRRSGVIAADYPDAIEAGRKLKTQIPRVENYGFAIGD